MDKAAFRIAFDCRLVDVNFMTRDDMRCPRSDQEYSKQLHGLSGKGESFRNDKLLEKQYNNFRKAYWKWRAAQYRGRK